MENVSGTMEVFLGHIIEGEALMMGWDDQVSRRRGKGGTSAIPVDAWKELRMVSYS